jgi:sec-independent protein translocase protein TatC
LEELRVALFRSVMGLMVGVAFGLAVANPLVQMIKQPLTAALENYYIEKSIKALENENPELKGQIDGSKLGDFIKAHRLVFEQVFMEAAEVERVSKLMSEEAKKPRPPAPADAETASDDGKLPVTPASAEKEPPPPTRVLGDEKLPPPTNVLVTTRVWRPIQTVVKALSAHEVFMIWMKAALVAGAVIASPYIFVQIWNFVAAGLYPHEKRYVYIYLPFSLGLFLAGAALAFFGVMKPVLDFLFTFNRAMDIDPDPRISEWLGFVMFMPLGFGISFQLPLVMLLLNRMGILSIETYISKWRIAILVIFVISMILTPADPFSMLFMAIPLTFLYFGGIGLCKWMPRGRNPFDVAYEP